MPRPNRESVYFVWESKDLAEYGNNMDSDLQTFLSLKSKVKKVKQLYLYTVCV